MRCSCEAELMSGGPESILLHAVMHDVSPSHFLLQDSVCRMMEPRLNFSVSLSVHSHTRSAETEEF